jgi:hypothetical protein
MNLITWGFLRGIGFRLTSHHVDNTPHMLCSCHQNQEVGLELAQSYHSTDWFVWLRSDLAHSKCRFCFVRYVRTEDEIIKLLEAITGNRVCVEEFDLEVFRDSLEREKAECLRRYAEYARNERWGRIPGGL